MSVKLLTDEASKGRLSLFVSKYHIVEHHMSRLICILYSYTEYFGHCVGYFMYVCHLKTEFSCRACVCRAGGGGGGGHCSVCS